jgi:hypothetical protein
MTRSTTGAIVADESDVRLTSAAVSLRTYTIERPVALPDGRQAILRLGLAQDDYIPKKDQETVVLELRIGEHVEAVLDTILDPGQEDEGARMVREVAEKLESGELEPTAGALEPYADSLP